MNVCPGCGTQLVRHWPHPSCGACLRSRGAWTEAQHEAALRACHKLMDARLRSPPFFTPVAAPKKADEDDLS